MPRESLAAIADAAPKVNAHISDLFFNLDLEDCKDFKGGQFATWRESELRSRAEWFVSTLAEIGVTPPEVDDVLADFYGRV